MLAYDSGLSAGARYKALTLNSPRTEETDSEARGFDLPIRACFCYWPKLLTTYPA
jgi:hypothetical protein